MFGLQVGGVEVNGGKTEGRQGIDIPLESGGPGERGEVWEVARDLSRSKLNLSPSLLLQLWSLCPWAASADEAGFVFVPLKQKKYQDCNLITKLCPRSLISRNLKKKLSKFGLLRKYQIKKMQIKQVCQPRGIQYIQRSTGHNAAALFSPFNITIS